jgi:hypothetical protein
MMLLDDFEESKRIFQIFFFAGVLLGACGVAQASITRH